jgi:hypothetical protein
VSASCVPSGDEVWTVAPVPSVILDIFTIRKLCDIADQFAEGYIRFTIRSNIEFMVSDEAKVQPPDRKLEAEGFPIGGTGNSVTMISHTQGWLHCDIPGTDASGVVKALMDEFTTSSSRKRCRTACTSPPPAARSTAAARVISPSTSSTPNRRRSTTTWWPTCASVRLRRGPLPGGRDSSRAGQRQALAGSGREEVHLLRRLFPALPADADQRSRTLQAGHLGGR